MNKGSTTVLAIAGIAAGLAVILIAAAIYNHPKVTCHWQVPLKTNYQTCTDGTVKEIK